MSSYVFVDSRVRNYDLLLASLAPDTQVVILDSTQDGVAQIAQALEGVTDLDAIHIISHGSEGTLYLGDTVLTSDNLDYYTSELSTVGAALSDAGDILLYGCDVANGVTGPSFIENLALYTGADVAASTNYTGSATLNGDWVLEASIGRIEATTLVAANDFKALLAAPTLGLLDNSFDVDGIRIESIGAGGDYALSMTVQPDGKIVLPGSSYNGTSNDFALVWYNADGSLDITFDGDGKLTTQIGSGLDQITSTALQADGKIVAAGYSFNGMRNDFALARFNATGSLDTTFGTDGKVTTSVSAGDDLVNAVAIQADGKIIAAGYSDVSEIYVPFDQFFSLARYNTNGSLDTTFGGDGVVWTSITLFDQITSTVLQADGKILVAGGSDRDFVLARYNTNGSLDTTFDGDGIVRTSVGASYDEINSMVVQIDGKIVVAGYSIVTGSNYNFALARYNANGSLDSTFSGDGKLTTHISNGVDRVNSVALQADGKIVVAGYSYNGTDYDFALARYNSNGSLDTAFDGDGKLIMPVGTGTDFATDVKIQGDGAILVAGVSSGDFAVARLIGDGSLANRGIADVAAAVNTPLNLTFSTYTFIDPDGGTLTYSASTLPSWLTFDAGMRSFNGTPGLSDVGQLEIKVTATDAESLSVDDIFMVAITNLVATSGADTLYGGLGADTMTGLEGDDVYIVDNAADGVVEGVGAGSDLVRASAAHILDENVEKLVLIGVTSINGTGNGIDNLLTGNSAANQLGGGDGNDTLSGNADNDTLNGGDGDDTLNGGTGIDLASYAGAASAVTVNLSNTSAQNTIGAGTDMLSNLENLAGSSYNDTLTGGTIANLLKGELGHDNLNGGLGNDTLEGGDGDDTLNGSTGDDSLTGGAGLDWAYYNGAGSAVTVNLTTTAAQNTQGAGTDTLNTLENVLGSNYNDTLTGNSAANQLDGGAGNDTIDGGTGNDTMKGGSGNDQYTVAQSGDVVIENAGAGTDTVQSSVTHTLATNVEHLTLTGTGNATANGNTLANSLTGNSGNNTLNGGTGNDTMAGGLGNDTYVVNAAGDVVTEAAAAGTDLVQASTSHTLAVNVENLTLSGTGHASGNGNTLNNILAGNVGNNNLNGGTGNDTMIGGTGNDSYSVNAAGDVVTEGAGAGTDSVSASLSYTLTANVENLTLTGAGNATGTGNTQNNKITGNSGDNTLIGNNGADTLTGGGGADTLAGGTGIDIFDYNALTDAGDIITDFVAGAGGDQIDIDTLLTLLGYGEQIP